MLSVCQFILNHRWTSNEDIKMHKTFGVLLVLQTATFGFVSPDLQSHLEQYVLRTWTNHSFYGFQGIRYAEPPIGDRKFQVCVSSIFIVFEIEHIFNL